MSKKGSNDQTQTVTQRTDIPSFLQPFLTQSTGSASSALTNLSGLLGSGGSSSLVAPFNDTQQQAMQLAIQRALGGGGFFPAAQQQLLDTANGRSIDSILPPEALAGLRGFGGDLSSFLPTSSLDALTSTAGGGAVPSTSTNVLGDLARGGQVDPAVLQRLMLGAQMSPVPVEARNAAGDLINADLIPGGARDTLQRTANGDFLSGGPAFDAAVQAAVRAARPGVISTFGSAGSGGATGGLAQTAIGQAAIDAFAGQYGQERSNQLNAAGTLANLGLAGGQQKLSAAGLLGNLDLSGNAQQLGAAESLGNLGLNIGSQRAGAASALGNLGLNAQQLRLSGGQALAGLSDSERNRLLQSGVTQAGLLGDLTNSERSRALTAAGALPSIGTSDVDLLTRVGGMQQGQTQQEISAPIDANQMLLQLALAGLPIGSLLGQSSSQPIYSNNMGNALGGASLGYSLFNNSPWGALGGALLGGFGG